MPLLSQHNPVTPAKRMTGLIHKFIQISHEINHMMCPMIQTSVKAFLKLWISRSLQTGLVLFSVLFLFQAPKKIYNKYFNLAVTGYKIFQESQSVLIMVGYADLVRNSLTIFSATAVNR